MKVIGGYFELECGHAPLYYPDGIYLNLCRSAFRYIVRALGINEIYIPRYTCNVVADAIAKENCKIQNYDIDHDLMPLQEIPTEAFVIYNNYFGVCGHKVEEMARIYPNLIVDNAQAFYSAPDCRAAVYSPRKFFGLPDGGILRGNDIPVLPIEPDNSYTHCSHLLKRHDLGAEAAYNDFAVNDKQLEQSELKAMSPLTLALMGNIAYQRSKKRRLDNFNYLLQHLQTEFPISLAEDDVPMVYPLLHEDGQSLRKKLISNKIFCAGYWPTVSPTVAPESIEYNLATNLVNLPIDQRYTLSDMHRILELIVN